MTKITKVIADAEAPRKLLQFSDFRASKSCILMSNLPSPVATVAAV